MRLIDLSVSNFRGFGSGTSVIRLDGDLVLIYGPNGFGKTSIAEAIEWLFYGYTKRRSQGEEYSKSEYAGTYANAHNGKPVQVAATIKFNNVRHTISRRLLDDRRETTETFIDGVRASFTSIGLVASEAVYPVIAQHGLQSFIHSKPKDRRNALGAALGLQELTILKSTLESARSSFQRSPPSEVVTARKDLILNLPALRTISEAMPLVNRWQKIPMQVNIAEDTAVLLKVSESLTALSLTTEEDALAALRVKRSEAASAIFDVSKISPMTTEVALSVEDSSKKSTAVWEEFQVSLSAVIAGLAAKYGSAVLEFWVEGLRLAPDGEECPMCEAPTLTIDQRTELKGRILQGAEAITTDKAFIEKVQLANAAISTFKTELGKIFAKDLTDTDRTLLGSLVQDNPYELALFLTEYDKLKANKNTLLEVLTEAEIFLSECGTLLLDPKNAPMLIARSVSLYDRLKEESVSLDRAAATYGDYWKIFEPILNNFIESKSTVIQIDAVGKSLRLLPEILTLEKYDLILAETQDLIRMVEDRLQKKQIELLGTRGGEVKAFYDLLNPGADVVFDGMEPGTDQMKLHAKSFGVQMSAAANLSECHLNCLGLAVLLMQATTPSSPFNFIVLDDPVQSMDDDHSEAFMSVLVPHLIDKCGKQIIILSHVQEITDRIRNTNLVRPHIHYHLDKYVKDGPTVVERALIKEMLKEIKESAKGSEYHRSQAVDRLRVLVEAFIRELHLQKTGVAAPAEYNDATASGLLKLFRTIQDTTPSDHASLSDVVEFTNPAHHTEVGYSIPSQTNIQPNIDKIENLLQRHGINH